MSVNKKWKEALKLRIKLSNEAEKNGNPPDPWVVEFRIKNNAIKASWKAKQPKLPPKKKVGNSGSFKKGNIPHNLKSKEHRIQSLNKWRQNTNQWHKNNKERVNKIRRDKRANNPSFKIISNLRKRLSSLLRLHMANKSSQTLTLLGCDMPFFMRYLECKFTDGMSFSNYGEWHIDHIIPCDNFDFTKPEDQAKCFHYTNLQPLWGLDNRIKSNKIIPTLEVGKE